MHALYYFLVPTNDASEAVEAFHRWTEKHCDENNYHELVCAVNEENSLTAFNKELLKRLKDGSIKASDWTIESVHRKAWKSILYDLFFYDDEKVYEKVVKEFEKEPLNRWTSKLISMLIDLVQEAYEDLLPNLVTGEENFSTYMKRWQYVIALETLLEIQRSRRTPPFAYDNPFFLTPYNWRCFDLRYYTEARKGETILVVDIHT